MSKKVLNDALIPIAKENWRQIGVLLTAAGGGFQRSDGAAQSRQLRSRLLFSTQHSQRPARRRMGFLQQLKPKSQATNNAEVDKLINAGNAVLDVEKRKPIYHQLYQVLADDPPVILLGYRQHPFRQQRHASSGF